MEETKYDGLLLIEEEPAPAITEEEAKALFPIQKRFMESYLKKEESVPLNQWLEDEMAKELPYYSREEVASMSREIIDTLRVQEEKKASIEKAAAQGRSKESWFAKEVLAATSYASSQEAAKYLINLDKAVSIANESLQKTIHTQSGGINMNPSLDGFIAEQYHVQTFNLNAEATGSPYRARVVEPDGHGYGKNSVDIIIENIKENKIISRWQSKYCKDAEATRKAFESGDYRGQRKLVPDGQDVPNASTYLKAKDGTTSKPLTKERAKQLQDDAQSGNWKDLDWNEYRTKDLAMGIGKKVGQSAVMGAAIAAGAKVIEQVSNGEEIDGKEVLDAAIDGGVDFGVKAAAAGAIKVGVERGIVKIIPKGTPAGDIANIVHVSIENLKIIKKIATGKLSLQEGFDEMERTTVSCVAGIYAGAKGAAIGASIGMPLGAIGIAVGGFIGGTIGYMAGSTVGETITKVVQKVRNKANEVIKNAADTISRGVAKTVDAVRYAFLI